MKAKILTLLVALSVSAFADWIIMTPEEQELNRHFPASATQEDAVNAFNSRHHLLHQRALEWLLSHRDIQTWEKLKDQKEKLKEVSAQLYPILDQLAAQPPNATMPLALMLRPADLALLVKKADPVPPRYEYAYLETPVDESLYRILAADLERFPGSNPLTAAAERLLLEYRAPSDALEQMVTSKAASTDAGTRSQNPRPEGPGSEAVPADASPVASGQKPEARNPLANGSYHSATRWMVGIAGLILVIAVARILRGRKS